MDEKEKDFEKIVETLATKIDEFSQKFVVGLETVQKVERQWYTPKHLVMRVLSVIATMGVSSEVSILALALYGCTDVLGIKGTIKFAGKFLKEKRRKKHGNTNSTETKKP